MVTDMALLHPGGTAHDERARPPTTGRVRALVGAAVIPLVTGYLAVAAVLAAATAMAPHNRLGTVTALAAAVPGWLAAHQVPLTLDHHELGALPLLPTILLMLLVARTAAATATRLGDHKPRHAGRTVALIATAHALCGLFLALLTESHPVTAAGLPSLTYPALLAALAATAGLARRCGLLTAFLERVDAPAAAGLRAGILAVVALLTAGAVLLVVALLGSITELRLTFSTAAPGFGAGTGLLLLSAGYLPNAVVGASAFLAGPGVTLGGHAIDPFRYTIGRLPDFPLMDAVPDRPAAWWPVLCVVPLAIGVFIGWRLRDVHDEPVTRLRAVAVAAVVAAMACVVLSGAAGGRLGGGALDPLSLRSALLSVTVLGWIAVPGGLVAWLRGPRPEAADPVGLIPFDDDEDDQDDQSDEPEPEPEPVDEEPPAPAD